MVICNILLFFCKIDQRHDVRAWQKINMKTCFDNKLVCDFDKLK